MKHVQLPPEDGRPSETSSARYPSSSHTPISGRYAAYALTVLVLVNVFALVDRQILAVLAEDIKADPGLSDSELGFVYGTSISVFYVIFSIPLARLADAWSRKNVLAGCVAAWSTMIFLTGWARSFLSFAAFRAGVGIGEAGCWPALMSLTADYFAPRFRSTAISIAAAGVPLGAGLGLLFGGLVLDVWKDAYPDPAMAPLGLRAWQVAFMAVALPGPFLAIWLWTLRKQCAATAKAWPSWERFTPSRIRFGLL